MRRTTSLARSGGPGTRADHGTTFIELLISIVLIGTVVVATVAALTSSIRGSDQHRAKVAALADLESAAAFLAREGRVIDCASVPPPTRTDVENLLSTMPGSSNPGVDPVDVNGDPDCATGLPEVSLTATHSGGRATESLTVIIGGITVLSPGDGLPSGGPCTPGVIETPPGLTASGNKLNQPLTVKLFYTGECPTTIPPGAVTVTLTATINPPGSNTATLTMVDSGAGLFEATFATNALKFRAGPASVAINFNGTPLPIHTFSIG